MEVVEYIQNLIKLVRNIIQPVLYCFFELTKWKQITTWKQWKTKFRMPRKYPVQCFHHYVDNSMISKKLWWWPAV